MYIISDALFYPPVEPMNILFFSSYPYFSGSHKMALMLAEIAREAGHTVTIGAPEQNAYIGNAAARGFNTRVYQAAPELLAVGGEIAKGRWLKKLRTLGAWIRYNAALRRAFKQEAYDLIYCAQQRGVLQIGFGARMAGAPVLWHVQSGLPETHNAVHRLCGILARHVLCVSHAVMDDVRRALPRHRNISVMHNALPDITAVNNASAHKNGDGFVRILLAGNLCPHRGAHVLIEALGALPRAARHRLRVHIAGWILDEAYHEHLKAQVTQKDLQGIVEIAGYCEDIEPKMADSDIVVCPVIEHGAIEINGALRPIRWKEGFNLSALEAMRAGKPVIASASYGLCEVVEDGISGILVPSGEAQALKIAIEKMTGDENLRQSMGSAGRTRYETLFRQERMAAEFIGFLGKIERKI
jgi:glycosyltransferase involved in cell wall biosynthesis